MQDITNSILIVYKIFYKIESQQTECFQNLGETKSNSDVLSAAAPIFKRSIFFLQIHKKVQVYKSKNKVKYN